MFLSANDIETGSKLEADIVIVGAGAAGITIARQFANTPKSVLVLESGADHLDEPTQALYQGSLTGIQAGPPLDASRLRFFGGTTNHWTGWCRPLEPSDFEHRPDWPESGWPISRSDLDPWYREAAEICDLGPVNFDDPAFWRRMPGGNRISALPLDRRRFKTAIFRVSARPRFAEAYRPELQSARNVHVVENANVMEFLPGPGHAAGQARKHVGRAKVRTLSGKTFTASGKVFIVAAGGIETARLLLLSQAMHPNGAGNEHDLVGRYFMDHVWLNANCYLHFSRPNVDLPFYFEQMEIADAPVFGKVASTRELCLKEQIGGFGLWLTPSGGSVAGIESAHALSESLAHGRLPDHFLTHLGNMLADIDVLADATYKTVFHTNKGWLSANKAAPVTGAWIDLNFEQRPSLTSRVQLSAERDALGQRRVAVNWDLGETDRRTATRALELAAQEFGRIGLGRCRIDLDLANGWPSNLISSCHHSGTARMSDNPATGVVDRDCRVHSADNLYVAGSAVFPTAGYANPTFTIVALALRLADHLKKVIA